MASSAASATTEKGYGVPADWKSRAWLDEAKYQEMYARSIATRTASGPSRPSASTGSSPTKIKNTSLRPGQRLDQMVRGRRRSTSPTTASTAISPSAATRPRSSGKATTRRVASTSPISELHDEVCRFANVLQQPRRQEGRPRHHLHADDPRGGLRDARLRAHRRDPLGGVRRLLAGLARRPHRGLRSRRSSSPPTRACAAAARCRSRPTSTRPSRKVATASST